MSQRKLDAILGFGVIIMLCIGSFLLANIQTSILNELGVVFFSLIFILGVVMFAHATKKLSSQVIK